jgi:hypothetical protein
MVRKACPLAICDGSGFILLDGGEEEDNCPCAEERPTGGWTPAAKAEFLTHYDTPHRFGTCSWCARYAAS